MYLKRLELIGFKSFAQKTVLDFPAGIAAVVGPNGSGKSNIIDAIRWLLGEREAKNMRSLRAEDLIFTGTPQRPRVGLAQAAITFDNHSRFFPVDYAEISVRRRLDREGVSEHFLNGSQVRLKDIIDFFAQSRLGTKGFSIINQGDADLFVRAPAKERRAMLEEILGLRQFELKKHEAELKLRSTRFNMDKAKALIDEILPHLRLLRRQTSKWEKHDELVQELHELENQYFGAKLREFESQAIKIEPELKKLDGHLEKLGGELKELQSELTRVEKRQPRTSEEAKSFEIEKEELSLEKAKLERELGRLEAQIELTGGKNETTFDTQELVRILEETQETIEDALIMTDLKIVKRLLQSLSEKIGHVLEGETSELKPQKRELTEDPAFLKSEVHGKLSLISKKLAAIGNLEKQENQTLKNFNEFFRRAFESVEGKKDAIRSLENQRNKLMFEHERVNLRREELRRQAEQIGRKLEEFKSITEVPADIMSVERRMLRLRGELASIGEIDEALIKEARETETRYEFLSVQLKDLEKAHKDLSELIKELDAKIHHDFTGALKDINEEFQKYFRMMFGGGSARLKMRAVMEEEMEQGGIDIDLNIPRKRIGSLDMLSGGEKSLVSLAVLFALISVSPPPFLVLDEVDAALDEVNSRRFSNLIKDFSKKTQFVVVTHNRATMEAADLLYGVTMGEDGTSKVLSLKLE